MPTDLGPMDTSDPPSPHGGWSSEIVTLSNAVVIPPERSAMVQECGVLAADGSFCAHSATWRGGRPTMTPPKMPTDVPNKLAGRHLFAGQIWAHFGHFIAESMSRLWALDHLDDLPDSILFIPKRPAVAGPVRGFQKEFIELLGVKIPVQVISAATEVEELIVPGQGFGLGAISGGTEKFRSYFANNFALDVKPEGAKKIYLSRSKLGGLEGGAVLEETLEANLANEGYEICHPQMHSLRDQVAMYRAAEHVVGLDGSAFHLFAFVARPQQKVAIILRRNSNVFRGLKIHIEKFSGAMPVVISAVSADWIPENKKRPGRYSFGQLDFGGLFKLLQLSGFIEGRDGWTVPQFRQMKRAMRAFGQEKGLEYNRVKASRKIEIVEPV